MILPNPPDSRSSSSLLALEWPRLLEALGARLSTPHGQWALEALAPLAKPGAVRYSLSLIDEMKNLRRGEIRLSFSGIHPLEQLLERASREGRLEVEELSLVLSTQRGALQLKAELKSGSERSGLVELADSLHSLRECTGLLAHALTPAGTLNERSYPELARLREELGDRREAIHRKLEGLLRNTRLAPVFQDRIYSLRGRRYVLPVKADFRGQLPGIVHDVSASGATLFVEPQSVVEDTNALAMAEKQLELEADRILRDLSRKVGEVASPLRDNQAWIGRVDLLHAQALLSEAYLGTAPRVESEAVLDLKGAAHPLLLLEEAHGRPAAGPAEPNPLQAVVRNRVRLEGTTRCMVISGANTGGKTVLLKTVGLCALLVRHGMHIPARAGSRCGLFREVWADIGDQQSLDDSLSTFSAQIRFLAEKLERVGEGSLVLLDEMLTGTEPAQGAALGAAVLEMLLERGATTIVTTHFGELKELAARREDIVNASMAFDPEQLRPTFRLEVGLPGASYALHIARRYGLPDDLVANAERTLADRPEALDDLLVQYHEARHKLAEAEARVRMREEKSKRREEELNRGRQALNEREQQLRRRERGEISTEFRTARKRVAKVIRSLQSANSLPLAGKVREELAALEEEHESRRPKPPPSPPSPASGALEEGSPVWLPSLDRQGVLEAIMDGGRRARILLGSLTMEVDWEDLAALPEEKRAAGRGLPEKGQAAKRPPLPTEGGAAAGLPEPPGEIPFALSTEDNTLDVRGLRLDEAITQAEQFFDRCTMKHVSPVLVIHGHGTGRLKAGLRETLRESPYVNAFRPGQEGEGRDGVTVVALNL